MFYARLQVTLRDDNIICVIWISYLPENGPIHWLKYKQNLIFKSCLYLAIISTFVKIWCLAEWKFSQFAIFKIKQI